MARVDKLIGARVSPKIHALVDEVSRARGEDISSFIRRLVLTELARLHYLSDDQKKALGIPMEPGKVTS